MKTLTIDANNMTAIIETNLSIKDGVIVDHQSRVIEMKSWDEYVSYYKQNLSSDRQIVDPKSLTNLWGVILPRFGDITEFKYDDFHLSCYHTNPDGKVTMKLAYLCE